MKRAVIFAMIGFNGFSTVAAQAAGDGASDVAATVVDGGTTPGGTAQQCMDRVEVDIEGVQRTVPRCWAEVVPTNLAKPVKIVMDLHGNGGSIDQQLMTPGSFGSIREQAGFVHVVPQGLLYDGLSAWAASHCCCGGAAGSTTDDVGFLKALAAHIAQKHAADVKDVYWFGHSNGAGMVNTMAVKTPEVVGAIASFSQYLSVDVPSALPQGIPMIHVHGALDPVATYQCLPCSHMNGKPQTPDPCYGAMTNLATWARLNQCGVAAQTCDFGGYKTFYHSACPGNVEVAHVQVPTAGHVPLKVPNGVFPDEMGLGPTQSILDVAQIAWDFLKRFPAADGGLAPVPAISGCKATCGEVKAAYKASKCCGNPTATFNGM